MLHVEHIVVERHALEHLVLHDDEGMLDGYAATFQIIELVENAV